MSETNRTGIGVWFRTFGFAINSVLATAEHFGLGFEFGVDFQADNDIVVHKIDINSPLERGGRRRRTGCVMLGLPPLFIINLILPLNKVKIKWSS